MHPRWTQNAINQNENEMGYNAAQSLSDDDKTNSTSFLQWKAQVSAIWSYTLAKLLASPAPICLTPSSV